MDKEAVAYRNKNMAQAFHTLPFKHYVRRALLNLFARVPLPAVAKENAANRILLIRPDHLGDVLLTTPAIHALRHVLPNAEIHALLGPWSADVIANYPQLDAVLTFPFPGFNRSSANENLRSPYDQVVRAARYLRRIGYGSAVILRPDHWWGALLAHLAGIPNRIGYNLPDVAPFLTHSIEHKHEHAVLQNMRLVERWTGKINPEAVTFQHQIAPIDRAYVNGYLTEWGIAEKQALICIHPGSGTWVKRWQEEKWAAVADTLSEQIGVQVVLTGGDHELPLIQTIASAMKHRPCIMAGDTQVGQLAALFQRALVVLGPDSGPLHLAAAVGTPTVTLFGPADPTEFRPWGAREKHFVITSSIDCRPCRVLDWGGDDPAYHPCVRDISIGAVLEAARRAANTHKT